MKKHLLIAGILLAALTVTGCKSNQKSMQSLYEQATEQDAATAVEEVTPVKPSTPARPATPAAKDRTERVTLVNSGDAGLLKAYNVVVGTFGQSTNAEAMKNKMKDRRFNAFLVKNESGQLRVIAGGYNTRDEAESVRDAIRGAYPTEAGTCADAWLLIPQP